MATLPGNATYRRRNREKLRQASRARTRRLKLEALSVYGMVCRRCDFGDDRALQIDHVNDDGAAERKLNGGQGFAGWNFYAYLKRRGWPSGYQTLCANCNAIKLAESRSRRAAEAA